MSIERGQDGVSPRVEAPFVHQLLEALALLLGQANGHDHAATPCGWVGRIWIGAVPPALDCSHIVGSPPLAINIRFTIQKLESGL